MENHLLIPTFGKMQMAGFEKEGTDFENDRKII
jgi:hypothetical protein